MICVGCSKELERIKDHRNRWTDIKGRLWNGNSCPDCHRISMKLSRKPVVRRPHKGYARDERVYSVGPKLNSNPLTKRKCRICSAPLPASNYFKCDDCGRQSPEYWDMGEYCGISVKPSSRGSFERG